MTINALIKIVILHTNGHQIYIAPWIVWVTICMILLSLLFTFMGWMRRH